MTPAIAAPAPLDVPGLRPCAPAAADRGDDSFRSALSALFAMVGGALPAPELLSESAQATAPSTVAVAFEGAGPLVNSATSPLEGEAGPMPLDECDATTDDPLELRANPEPELPAATITQILGFAEVPPALGEGPQAPQVPARERFAQQRSEQAQAEVLPPAAALAEAPPIPAGEVAFEAVISEAPVPNAPEPPRAMKLEAPAAEATDDDVAAQPEAAASKTLAAQPDARPVKVVAPQADAQTRQGTRDGSQRPAFDAESRRVGKRPSDAPPASRGMMPPGIRETREAAPSRPRVATPQAPRVSPEAAIERASETRTEPVALRHLRLQVAADAARPISVLVAERAGAVHVSVRASDPETAGVLRGDLQRLVADLERSGLRAETFAPSDARVHEPARAAEAETFGRGEAGGRDGQRRWQQQDSRPQSRKRDGDEEDAAFSLEYGLEKTE